MKRQPNPKLIGFFVVGGVLLLFLSIVLLSSARFFTDKRHFVMYFKGSVNGLVIGSPVKFRGVKIGAVSNVSIQINHQTGCIEVPVIIELAADRFYAIKRQEIGTKKFIKTLIGKGLRGQLEMESLITGQLFVELDFHSDAGTYLAKNTTNYMQIPTVDAEAGALTSAFVAFKNAMKSVDDLVKSEQFKLVLTSFTETMQNSDEMVKRFNKQIDPVANKMWQTLDEMSDTFAAIRVLVDYLERHPESILMGKRKR